MPASSTEAIMSIRAQLLHILIPHVRNYISMALLAPFQADMIALLFRRCVFAGVIGTGAISLTNAQEILPAAQRMGIDRAVIDVLAATGTPSASIAIVRDAKIIYEHAY